MCVCVCVCVRACVYVCVFMYRMHLTLAMKVDNEFFINHFGSMAVNAIEKHMSGSLCQIY